MIVKVEMYTVVCDNCGEDVGALGDYSCWNDENYAIENAGNADWLINEDKHYCPDCWSIDDEDEVLINKNRKDLYK